MPPRPRRTPVAFRQPAPRGTAGARPTCAAARVESMARERTLPLDGDLRHGPGPPATARAVQTFLRDAAFRAAR
ncbi:hypothetical protein TPA0907_34870 [Micromonospora humidisoli]|nr:hypothetical protein TPA0907_34870 [Micromonospora sp. AKA109]